MKKFLLEKLICPICLPDEYSLHEIIEQELDGDILQGSLNCPQCSTTFPIDEGIAFLHQNPPDLSDADNKYEQPEVVSSYLWSHYSDLFDDEHAPDTYTKLAEQIKPHEGIAVDLGTAVGRFTFEMSTNCNFAVGIDNSVAFIKTARDLMKKGQMKVALKEEGHITREAVIRLPSAWRTDRIDFIVGDAQKIPFKSESATSLASLNLIDKVSQPFKHLEEMNRVTRKINAQFLLSDPFSWSTEAAEEKDWLGGTHDGPFSGRGLENIIQLLKEGANGLGPSWDIEDTGWLWWKIRTHTNHYELIRSCFVKATR